MKPKIIFWGLVLTAIYLRFYKLGIIPYGYSWDETSIIYNAWGIALWHRDEWAQLLPLAFRSFGDYKAPLLFYALAVPFKFLGVIEPLIRYYAALAGIGTVIATYAIAKYLAPKHPPIPLIAMALVAFSPWAINFSRAGFEANVALCLFTLGFYWLLAGEKQPKAWIGSALAFSLSLYAYHAAKIAVPVIILWYVLIRFSFLKTRLKQIILPLLFGILMTVPLLFNTLYRGGFERGMTMIFFNDQKQFRGLGEIVTEFTGNLNNELSLPFLIGGQDAVGLRHLTPGHGIIYVVELPFLLYGIFQLFHSSNRTYRLLFGWLVAGILPALLSHQTPHAVRSLLVLPGLALTTTLGVSTYIQNFQKTGLFIRIFAITLPAILYFGQWSGYEKTYYSSYAIASAPQYQYGYREALTIASELGRTRDKIVVTDAYGQPYVYVLLTNRIKPAEFLAGALANYEFHTFSWPYYKPNSVIVGTPAEIPPRDPAVKALVKIPGTDQILFVVAVTPP